MTPAPLTARDRAIHEFVQLLANFERHQPRGEWRHTDVAALVDALIDAARASESDHTRALDEERASMRDRKDDPR